MSTISPTEGVTTGGAVFYISGAGVTDFNGNDIFSGAVIDPKWSSIVSGSGSVSQLNGLTSRSGATPGSVSGLQLIQQVIDTDASVYFILRNNITSWVPDNTIILACYSIVYDANNLGRIFLQYNPILKELKIITEIKKNGSSVVYDVQKAPDNIFSEIKKISEPSLHKFRILRIGSRLIFLLDGKILLDDYKGNQFLDTQLCNLEFYVDNLTSTYDVVTDFYNHRVETLILFDSSPVLKNEVVTTTVLRGLTPPRDKSGVVSVSIVPFSDVSPTSVQSFTYSYPNELRVLNQIGTYLSLVDTDLRNPLYVTKGFE